MRKWKKTENLVVKRCTFRDLVKNSELLTFSRFLHPGQNCHFHPDLGANSDKSVHFVKTGNEGLITLCQNSEFPCFPLFFPNNPFGTLQEAHPDPYHGAPLGYAPHPGTTTTRVPTTTGRLACPASSVSAVSQRAIPGSLGFLR